ncbi:coat protein [Rhizoctonia oryzae-sativae partitivirus 1]|nr:coat protein [Rhizoctonia oryzae-sativae partitivirus 1]
MSTNANIFKNFLHEHSLEDKFLKAAGLNSLDELDPTQFPELKPELKPKVVSQPSASAARVAAPELPKEFADAKTGSIPEHASDMLEPFIGDRILYSSRKKLSSYYPSALMMDYIVHVINEHLVDHFYFKRYCPDYHPYILRLYFGILFYIQVMRAMLDVKTLPDDQHQFLVQFLEIYPPSRLPIPGPLVTYFKTLCSSQPEILQYGKVYPAIPSAPGPITRSAFVNSDSAVSIVQPNIPGILALLYDLNSLISADPAVYPKKGKHIPVTDKAVTFGHHAFPAQATRTDTEKWSLVSSGLQYPCEADAKLNDGFAERYENFDLPATDASDDLRNIANFLSLNKSRSWFSQVRDVADAVSAYTVGSGTLADCSPTGIVANQIQVQYLTPSTLPTAPTQIADKKSLFPFSYRMTTTMRTPPTLAEALAASAQTNVRMFPTHPFLGEFGNSDHRTGKFWDIRPIESSSSSYETYFSIKEIVKKMIKSRV